MLRWPNNQGVMGDDPPYLVVGTEVSAKYKGAFCEAKVRKVVRTVKCKVNFKVGGSAVVTDDQIRGTVRVGSVVEAKHPDRKEFVEASITKIQDCSQYTVVFDDGDITTLRRTALCLKSGRHFAESETLDQLPLTHPEHFGNPVVGNRRGGRRSRNPMSDESSDEEEEPRKGKLKEEKEADIGKVVSVELGDKKKQKDNWFPGLVVHPAAQEVVRIRVKDEYLVRSFKDGRYYTVPKKEAGEFTREISSKVDNHTLKTAVDKALLYLDKDELPPHWDRELLFRLEGASTASDSDAAFESDSSDDEPREEKDHFVAQLYKFMDDRGTPINRGPAISGKDIDLYKLFKVVHKLGGYNRVTNHNQWKIVSNKLGQFSNVANLVKAAYKRYLHSFEDFYRKLGCTMVNHPRGNRVRHRGGRSLIRDKDRATPVNVPRTDGKDKGPEDVADDDDDSMEKGEDSADISTDEKDEELSKRKEVREAEVTKLPLVPPPLERKPSDPQLKVTTPRGKPKRLTEGSGGKSALDCKKKTVLTKVKGARAVDEDEDDNETDTLDVEELEEEDEDKLTTTRSKAKEEISKSKIDLKGSNDADKKSRSTETNEKRIKPSLTASVEKKSGRPSLSASSDKKGKIQQDADRKTVRSLAAEFEKKSRVLETDKKDVSIPDVDKKSRSYSVGENDKKIKPSLTATLEKKKPLVAEPDKKSKGTDSEKKIRPSLNADPERKKVRPSLTADPTKKISRIDGERKKEKSLRPLDLDKDDTDKKSKLFDTDRKNSSSESSRLSSAGDSDRKSSKSDSGDSDKRSNSKSKKVDDEKRKQQVRKRRDNDEMGGNIGDDSLDQLPNYKNVCIGDKLKVYYGPTHESKVTYEAKVLEVEGGGQEETYLVHYTGWNNRYDEWIKRSRIADNLSWSPARGKRRHQTQLGGIKKTSIKRRTLTPGRDGTSPLQKDQSLSLPGADKSRDSQPPRSSTPSSVTSSSSRTKSPAMRPGSARVTRNNLGELSQQLVEQPTRRTRTRRISGQTDVVSESDSDASGSESEAEPSVIRKSSRRLASDRDDESSRKESISTRKPRKRETEIEVDDDEDKEVEKDDIKDEEKDEDDVSSESPSEDKIPVKRTRKGIKAVSDRKADVKIEADGEDTSPSQSSKGRDFDLNQIRSELKGIDKTVKATSPTEDDKDQKADSDAEREPDIDVDTTSLLEEKSSSLLEPEESTIDMEDVYEFKEPEPFEFEVRSKREPSAERTGKLPKRPLPRIFDDVVEPIVKKKITRPRVGDSESSEEGGSTSKKRFRPTITKKDDFDLKLEARSPSPERSIEKMPNSDQVTPQKKIFTSSDDAFEKLRQSPSYRFSAGSPIRAPTPTPSGQSPVHAPMHSPPQVASSSCSVITSSATISNSRPTVPSSSNPVVHSLVPKPIPIIHPKPAPVVPGPKVIPTPTPSLKSVTILENKSMGVKPIVTSTQNVLAQPLPSRPPVLAAVVNITSELGVITKADDTLKSRQLSPEKVESNQTDVSPVKSEIDESLPPLVQTTMNVPLAGRSSPEPPQLVSMATPVPKLFPEPTKAEAKDVPMPLIKKESSVDVDVPQASNSNVSQTSIAPSRPKTPVTEEQSEDLTEDDSPRKSGRRKAPIKRKKAVSKEFVDDSDSDSSDEERRLVIDKSESSDSCNESVETKLSLSAKDNEPKWRGLTKQGESSIDQQRTNVPKRDNFLVTKQKDQSIFHITEDAVHEETSLVVKVEEIEEPDVDTNLCSLLCEEEIPGSPAPPSDTPVDVLAESSSSRTSDRPLENNKPPCKVLEMPFASVPGNARSSGPSSSTNAPATQFPKTPSHSEKGTVDPVADGGTPKAGPSSVSNEAAPVMDNTPPTTPDSSISTISNSPRGEHGDSLSILDNDSSKSHRDSEDAENKDNDFSDDDLDVGTRMKKLTEKRENEREKGRGDNDSALSPSKKRRRSRKNSENEDRSKRPRHSSSRNTGQGAASDSDENTENPTLAAPTSQSLSQPPNQSPILTHTSSLSNVNPQTHASRSPRPSKYNFFVELAPELDASQRIALLQQTLQELRKTYANVKQQLVCIDRRRKKLRRREREARLEARKMMREERRQAREEVVSCS